MSESIFTKILDGTIPGSILYKDEYIACIKDINPQAKHHYLIIPIKLIPTINDIKEEDQHLIGKMYGYAAKLAQELGIAESGYRVVMNCNPDSGQEVYHIHLHLIGGEKLGKMC